jgi:cbb3-type cytochrome oxidase subunit 3
MSSEMCVSSMKFWLVIWFVSILYLYKLSVLNKELSRM